MPDLLTILVDFIVIVAAVFGMIVVIIPIALAVSQILGCVARNMREKD